MELDQLLFAKIARYFRQRKKRTEKEDSAPIYLADIYSRITIMGRLFSGKPIEIYPAEMEGGYKDHNFFLPTSVSLFATAEENLSFYFYRTIYLSIQERLGLNWEQNTPDQSLYDSRAKALETSKLVLADMELTYPEVKNLHDGLLLRFKKSFSESAESIELWWFYGKWLKNEEDGSSSERKNELGNDIRRAMLPDPTTTIKAKAVEEIKSIEVDTKQQEDYVLNHNFEKVETAEEFSGTWRDFDGDDDITDHAEALEELDLRFTVRVDDPTHSVYQADFIENTTIAESAEDQSDADFLTYPEWNYKKREYRDDYCKLFPKTQELISEAYYHKTIGHYGSILRGLRKQLVSLNNKRQEQRRQTDGPAFDLSAIVDLYCDVAGERTPSDKIYLNSRKNLKDLSILILLDGSLSSDSYVQGNRVLDVEKEVSIIFGEILEEFNTDFSVASFHSKTRNYSSYNVLKGFDENWLQARYKIGAAEPNGYTRIGTALRHAGFLLAQRPSRNRWVILLSDGKPNDYDRYEGKYGIQDVKQALRELYQKNVNSYALAIEAQARYYLPQMFGQNHYQILHTPDALLNAMVHLFDKIRSHS